MSTPPHTSATSHGDNSVSIGHNRGSIFVSLVAGPGIWSWPPFGLVVAGGVLAYTRAPEGSPQLGLVLGLFLAALVLAGARTLMDPARKRWRAVVTALALLLAVAGGLRVEELRESGDVDVTDRTTTAPARPLASGGAFTVTVPGEPRRAALRLTLKVSEGAPEAQSCIPDTALDVSVRGSGDEAAEKVRSGDAVELDLTREAKTYQVRATVRTLAGCLMNVSVTEALLHD